MSGKNRNTPRLGLIKTKLTALNPGEDSVQRQKILNDIQAHEGSVNLIEIVGAAGSGKSSIMGQLNLNARHNGRMTCWISLDREDNNLPSFLSYLTAALATIDPDLGARASQMIDTSYARDPGAIFGSLAEDISRHPNPIDIFLDDFQHIYAPDILNGLDKLIQALPLHVRLIISSRAHLSLRLSRKKIDGSLLSFDQSHLNFTTEETASLLREVHRLYLDDADTLTLAETTEGWAAGIQLAALALRKAGRDIPQLMAGFSGADKTLSAYLMESVFEVQESEIRDFLMLTAPLARMNATLCNHVCGIQNADNMIDELQRQSLFLTPLDSEGTWFRYHHLFAEFLVAELKRVDASAYEKVCQTASTWFQEQGLYTEAIQYLLQAKQFGQAAELIAKNGGYVAQYLGDHRTILDWMRRLPEKHHDHHPFIKLNYAWSYIFTQSAVKGRELVEGVKTRLLNPSDQGWDLDAEDTENAKCLADVVMAVSYASGDLMEEARSSAEIALAKWKGAAPFYRGSLSNVLAYTCISSLQFEKGLEVAAQARLCGLEANAAYVIAWSDWISACLCVKLGRLGDAEMHLHRGRQSVTKQFGTQSHASTLLSVLEAEIHCERGDFERARTCLGERSYFLSVLGSMQPLLVFQKTQARLLFITGQHDAALEFLRSCQEAGLTSETPRISIFLAAEEIRVLLSLGRVESANMVGRRWGFSQEHNIFGISCENPVTRQTIQLTQARLAIASADYKSAMGLLMELINQAKSNSRGRALVELVLLRAVALWNLDRRNEALRALAHATTLAAPERISWPFIELRDDMLEMFELLVHQRSSANFGHLAETVAFEIELLRMLRLDEEMTGGPPEISEADELIEALTQRETEILDLLVRGMTNHQLAGALLVSVPTIKWHLKNIYDKLDVRNRTAAVARARELKLIA